jgi:ArsR family transcriptional regulator
MKLSDQADLVRLFADPTRVRLLHLLEREELTVAELTRITRVAQSRVSTHLARLREAGLVRDRRAGPKGFHALRDGDMPDEARKLWELLRADARDRVLATDRQRLDALLRERGGTWADSVAGHMERHYSPGRTWEAALRGLLGLARLGRVLDVASGDCAISELVAPRARSVTCLDSSATVLAAGRRRLSHLPRVSFRRGDMHALPFRDGSFDHVLLLACLDYAREPAVAIAEACRVLAPGGNLVAVTLKRHSHREVAERYNHVQMGFEPAGLRLTFEGQGLAVELCGVTSVERRPPHFEVITVHARKEELGPVDARKEEAGAVHAREGGVITVRAPRDPESAGPATTAPGKAHGPQAPSRSPHQ